MNDSKKKQPAPSIAETDDVGRLFARLGSTGAEGYSNFEPNRLPVRETSPASSPAEPVAMAATAPGPIAARAVEVEDAPPVMPAQQPASPILATIHTLRADPAPRAESAAVAGTPLADLFQRLLQAESRPAAAGPLRRMFSR